jgi:hypothetical protein
MTYVYASYRIALELKTELERQIKEVRCDNS